MARRAELLEGHRTARDAARGVFDRRLAQVRQDLATRGIGGRLADRIGQDARNALDEAIEVADQNRGIVAGTILAVAFWIFRNPIISWAERLMGIKHEEEANHDRN